VIDPEKTSSIVIARITVKEIIIHGDRRYTPAKLNSESTKATSPQSANTSHRAEACHSKLLPNM